MLAHIPNFINIGLIAIGSFIATIASLGEANLTLLDGLGGWGVAVAGLYFLWNNNLKERKEAKTEREESNKRLEIERSRGDERHDAQIAFTSECTQALKNLTEKINCNEK